MEYSIFENVNLLLESFESIDKIIILLDRNNNKEAIVYLNNKYCDYEITIEGLKDFVNPIEFKQLHFVR